QQAAMVAPLQGRPSHDRSALWQRLTCTPRGRGARVGYSMPRQITTLTRLVLPAILLAALFPARSLGAETRVTGEPDAVRVEARDSRVEEVLVALGASFGLQYRSPSALSRRVSGTYEGSLRRVVTRLLDGYDFVMKTGSDGIEVTVYGSATPGA